MARKKTTKKVKQDSKEETTSLVINDLSADETLEFLQENPFVLIDVSTDWCYPCKIMHKEIKLHGKENLVKPLSKYGNLKVISIDAEKDGGFSKEMGVDGYPSFVLWYKRQLILASDGSGTCEMLMKELKAVIKIINTPKEETETESE